MDPPRLSTPHDFQKPSFWAPPRMILMASQCPIPSSGLRSPCNTIAGGLVGLSNELLCPSSHRLIPPFAPSGYNRPNKPPRHRARSVLSSCSFPTLCFPFFKAFCPFPPSLFPLRSPLFLPIHSQPSLPNASGTTFPFLLPFSASYGPHPLHPFLVPTTLFTFTFLRGRRSFPPS